MVPGVAQRSERADVQEAELAEACKESGKWDQILLTAGADERESVSDNGNTEDAGGLG